jgi:RNase P subunit RPR2
MCPRHAALRGAPAVQKEAVRDVSGCTRHRPTALHFSPRVTFCVPCAVLLQQGARAVSRDRHLLATTSCLVLLRHLLATTSCLVSPSGLIQCVLLVTQATRCVKASKVGNTGSVSPSPSRSRSGRGRVLEPKPSTELKPGHETASQVTLRLQQRLQGSLPSKPRPVVCAECASLHTTQAHVRPRHASRVKRVLSKRARSPWTKRSSSPRP